MRDTEVVYSKLSNEHKELFTRAKAEEVSSFLSNEAVRRCLDSREIQQAFDSGRILRAPGCSRGSWLLQKTNKKLSKMANKMTKRCTPAMA